MTDTPPYVRPDVALFLQFLNAVPGPKFWQVPVDDARAITAAMRDVADAPVGELAVIRDLSIPGPAGAIPARLYDSREEREAGFYDVLFLGEDAAGNQLRVGVTGDRDPGYGSTSKMITEAAVCLLRDALDTPGGIWTPASAMGGRLMQRLQAHAGLHFAVEAG